MPARKRRSCLYTQLEETIDSIESPHFLAKATSLRPGLFLAKAKFAFDAKPPSKLA